MEKADLSKGYQNPKRKLGVTTHFSGIIELKFGKQLPYILCILTHFLVITFALGGTVLNDFSETHERTFQLLTILILVMMAKQSQNSKSNFNALTE